MQGFIILAIICAKKLVVTVDGWTDGMTDEQKFNSYIVPCYKQVRKK